MLERKAAIKSVGSYYSEKFSLIGLLKTVFKEPEPIAHERKNRKELLKLLKLREHELADMGLSKADVKYALSLPLTRNSAQELDYARKRASKL